MRINFIYSIVLYISSILRTMKSVRLKSTLIVTNTTSKSVRMAAGPIEEAIPGTMARMVFGESLKHRAAPQSWPRSSKTKKSLTSSCPIRSAQIPIGRHFGAGTWQKLRSTHMTSPLINIACPWVIQHNFIPLT